MAWTSRSLPAPAFSIVMSSPVASCNSTLFAAVAEAVTPVVAEIKFILLTASVTSELLIAKALVLVPLIETV